MRENRSAPSIISVAKEAGVSLQTVSNVLNFPERVKPETTERVMQAINKLNYTPNLSARRLRSKKSASLAVRVDSNASAGSSNEGLYAGYIQDEFVYEVVKAAEARDIKVLTYTCGPDEDEVKKLKRLVDSRDVDGFLLTSTVEDDPRLKYLIQKSVPFLSFGRPWASSTEFAGSYPWIDVDGGSGTADATKMFWTLGYRNIGFLGWKTFSAQPNSPKSVGDDRFLGWSKSLQELLNIYSNKIETKFFELGSESISSARISAKKLITKFPEMDALVCASDTLALGAQLEYRGLKKIIPVSGFDNSPTSKVFNFTSLDQNISEIAASALVVLMGETGNTVIKVNDSKKTEQPNLIFKPTLISRLLK